MNTLRITILADGSLRTETDRFSAAVHQTAEEFLRGLTVSTGGPAERRAKHGHVHTHTHDGVTHSHDHDH